MEPGQVINRRIFLSGGAAFGSSLLASPSLPSETVYRFSAGNCEIRMSVEFFDNYSAKGFWFREQLAQRRFCLSGAGQENRNCLSNFTGAIAIARYHIASRSQSPTAITLTERVRTIDQDSRLVIRPPFERTIDLQDGVASDIQAFGYQPDNAPTSSEAAEAPGPWCLLRQDLYLRGDNALFLVIHWKHTLNAIRLFDVIPGDNTRLIAEPGSSTRKTK